ncbi:uncharacterized protein YALI1_D15557g [Yarrowia lipolytica]|uniref:Uncharacterized protein n=1 Tax=Yarrowia lipolytica TaxID=4952 RepID=A0A1D8NEA6_YARLL|nr:hypothetical protein YALI1_D15557g [Yarrowia lipolytica]
MVLLGGSRRKGAGVPQVTLPLKGLPHIQVIVTDHYSHSFVSCCTFYPQLAIVVHIRLRHSVTHNQFI